MPANRYGIDVGSMLRDVESIKGSRNVNRFNQLKLSEAERVARERPEKERLAKEREGKLFELRSSAVGGDVDAQRKLLVLDPKEGPKFIDSWEKMDDREREQTKANIESIGKLSNYVLSGKDDEEQANRYRVMLNNLDPKVSKKMPQSYSPQFVELSLAKAQTMDQLLEAPTVRTIGKEDVAYRGGKEIERADVPVKPGTGAAGGLKSADESLMYRQTVELLGGLMRTDPETGATSITLLDPTLRGKVQAISAEAARIFQEEGNISRTEAVRRAAGKFGEDIPGVPGQNPNDPNNIRAYLLRDK